MTGREGAGATRRPVVGNDVVDLTDPRCVGRHRDPRFLDRVFTERERDAIESAGDPERALWLRWAAKEAAFKAATLLRGAPPTFVHRAFAVEGGTVRWDGEAFRWRDVGVGHRSEEAVHVVCRSAADGDRVRAEAGSADLPPSAGVPRERFTDRECAHLHSPASAWVRLHARGHLARLANVPEEELEIVCEEGPAGRSPPVVLHRGSPAPWTVSLSHHGALLGWVVARAAEGS